MADLDAYRAYLYDLMPEVCKRAGLDPALIDPDWNIQATGKLGDVFAHLGALDRRGHPVATLDRILDVFVGVSRGE